MPSSNENAINRSGLSAVESKKLAMRTPSAEEKKIVDAISTVSQIVYIT